MAKSIEEFGPQPLNVKALLDWMKEDLGSANAPVRTSATVLLGVLHRWAAAATARAVCLLLPRLELRAAATVWERLGTTQRERSGCCCC
jgi:hypothetical protein